MGLHMTADAVLNLGAVCIALTAVAVVVRACWRAWQKVERFLDDWFGEPARPGYPARPGMPERVNALEQAVCDVKDQVTPNGGYNTTLGDASVRIEKALGTQPKEESN